MSRHVQVKPPAPNEDTFMADTEEELRAAARRAGYLSWALELRHGTEYLLLSRGARRESAQALRFRTLAAAISACRAACRGKRNGRARWAQ